MNVVGVRYESSGRVHYLDPGELDLRPGDRVLTEVEAQVREAEVVTAPAQVIYSELRSTVGQVLRKAEPS